MFSKTTMELSTNIPKPRARAPRVSILREIPSDIEKVERDDDRKGDGGQDEERREEPPQSREDHQEDEGDDDGGQQSEMAEVPCDLGALVVHGPEDEVPGRFCPNGREPPADLAGDPERVRPVLLDHRQHDRGLAVDPDDGTDLAGRLEDVGDVR